MKTPALIAACTHIKIMSTCTYVVLYSGYKLFSMVCVHVTARHFNV